MSPSISSAKFQDASQFCFFLLTLKGLRIVQDMATNYEDVVPRSVYLVDLGGDMHTRHLEGNTDIALVPKPSADREDPSNWTRKCKLVTVWMAYVFTIGIGMTTAIQYSSMSNTCIPRIPA